MFSKVLLVCFSMFLQDDVSLLRDVKLGTEIQRRDASAKIDALITGNQGIELDLFVKELVDEIAHNASDTRSDAWDFATIEYLSRIAQSAPSSLANHANNLARSLQNGSQNRQYRLLSVVTQMGKNATALHPKVESQIGQGKSLLVKAQALAAAFAITRKEQALENYMELANSINSDEQLVFAISCQSISPVPVAVKQAVLRLVESEDSRVRIVAASTLYQWDTNDRESLQKLLDSMNVGDALFRVVGFTEPNDIDSVRLYALNVISNNGQLSKEVLKHLCQLFLTEDDRLFLQNLCEVLLNAENELQEIVIRELDSIHSKIGDKVAKEYAMSLKTHLVAKRKVKRRRNRDTHNSKSE